MSTDLARVSDHPVNLLEARWDRDHTNSGGGCQADADADTIQYLRTYEREHGVTFAALDNDALAAVREAYANSEGAQYTDVAPQALENLQSAVRDLLGLDAQ